MKGLNGDTNKWKNIAVLALLFCLLLVDKKNAVAQTYRWEAKMTDSVTKDGFYNIVLKPEIGAKLKDDLSDIRILDAENHQMPYVQKTEEPYFVGERFKEYPVVSKQIIDGCCTKLTIKNPGKKPINNICLILKNSDAVKVMRLAGSDDAVNWYGVKRYEVFYNNYSETDTKVVNYINFPVTDYLYYRLEIIDRGYWDEDRWMYWYSDRWSYPVNILQVGCYETYVKEGKYLKVPVPEFIQSDSVNQKKTYIKINFDDHYLINRIRFDLKGPRYYKRHAAITKRTEDTIKKKVYYEQLTTVELNSYSLNEFDLSYLREKELYMIIDNDDNRPLKLESIEAWQLTRYLKTYLEKGQSYRLVYGDSAAVAPVYDLRYFIDSIPQILPTLPVASIEAKKIDSKEIKKEKEKEVIVPRWFENKIYIWLAIGLVILFLCFMSWKMLSEMKDTHKE